MCCLCSHSAGLEAGTTQGKTCTMGVMWVLSVFTVRRAGCRDYTGKHMYYGCHVCVVCVHIQQGWLQGLHRETRVLWESCVCCLCSHSAGLAAGTTQGNTCTMGVMCVLSVFTFSQSAGLAAGTTQGNTCTMGVMCVLSVFTVRRAGCRDYTGKHMYYGCHVCVVCVHIQQGWPQGLHTDRETRVLWVSCVCCLYSQSEGLAAGTTQGNTCTMGVTHVLSVFIF